MLKIKNIKQAAGNTANWPASSGGYTEVFYNRETGEVWTVDQVSLGRNGWTQYDDPAIVKVCDTERHMTMKQIRTAIEEAVNA